MWNILEYDEVASTNLLAKEQLAMGAVHHGDVIQAWHQTAGRGRIAGRVWHDEPRSSLLMSVVIERMPVSAPSMQYLAAISLLTAFRSLAAGLPASSTMRATFALKWPNDILLNRKKVSGILSEGIWRQRGRLQSQDLRAMIVGIGVNVKQELFEDALLSSAISLKQVGITARVNEVRDVILDTFEREMLRIGTGSTAEQRLIEQVREELAWMSGLEPFDVIIGEGSVLHKMKYESVTDSGLLALRHEDGTRCVINAGSIESAKVLSAEVLSIS
jgi:BirA family biotin operon repressor/biotin-[acetyl-CoA-carboxylase] ligase